VASRQHQAFVSRRAARRRRIRSPIDATRPLRPDRARFGCRARHHHVGPRSRGVSSQGWPAGRLRRRAAPSDGLATPLLARSGTALTAAVRAVAPSREVTDSVRNLLVRSRLGHAFWAALTLRVGVGLANGSSQAAWLDVVTVLAGLALATTILLLVWRLWASHAGACSGGPRKLILSYVFIGVVPVVLLAAFFLFAGLLMSLHVSAFLFKRGFDDLVDEATVLARTAAVEVQRAGVAQADDVLARRAANAESRYRGVSMALVPRRGAARQTDVVPHVAGAWKPRGAAGGRASLGEPGRVRGTARLDVRGPPGSVTGGGAGRRLPGTAGPGLRDRGRHPDGRAGRGVASGEHGITLTAVSVLAVGESARPTPAGRATPRRPRRVTPARPRSGGCSTR